MKQSAEIICMIFKKIPDDTISSGDCVSSHNQTSPILILPRDCQAALIKPQIL